MSENYFMPWYLDSGEKHYCINGRNGIQESLMIVWTIKQRRNMMTAKILFKRFQNAPSGTAAQRAHPIGDDKVLLASIRYNLSEIHRYRRVKNGWVRPSYSSPECLRGHKIRIHQGDWGRGKAFGERVSLVHGQLPWADSHRIAYQAQVTAPNRFALNKPSHF